LLELAPAEIERHAQNAAIPIFDELL